MSSALTRTRVLECLRALARTGLVPAAFRDFVALTRPQFSDADARLLLWGEGLRLSGGRGNGVGIMPACGGAALSAPGATSVLKTGGRAASRKKRERSRDTLLDFLAELVGLVDSQPTHPVLCYSRGESVASLSSINNLSLIHI